MRKTYSTLTLAGALPFIACAVLPLAGYRELPGIGSLHLLANSYGLAIVCFLTGVNWATHLYRQGPAPVNLMIGGNVVFLTAWFAFEFGSLRMSLAIQLAALLLLLFVDRYLAAASVISQHYFKVRVAATAAAAGSILLILLVH